MAITAILTIGLAVPAIAQKTETTSDKLYAPGQAHWGNKCSIASEGDAVTIGAQFSGLFADGSDEATLTLAVRQSKNGAVTTASFDHKETKGRMATTGTNQTCDSTPLPEDHAIKTKGAGAERQRSNNPSIYVNGTVFSCTVSGDSSNPVISISMVVPMPSGKATITDLNFMSVNSKRTSASGFGESPGAGGMAPHVKDAFICTTASGEASDVTALLLPAIQK